MIYRTLVVLAGLALSAAVPTSHRGGSHRSLVSAARGSFASKVAALQAVNPSATKAACEHCVGAEDALIKVLDAEEGATDAQAKAAEALAAAADEHANAEKALHDAHTTVADKKAAVQAIVTGDQGDLEQDSPTGILASVDALKAAAEAWAAAIKARTASQGVVDEAALKKTHAAEAEAAAAAALAGVKEQVAAARHGADTMCAIMRNGGYGGNLDCSSVPDFCVEKCLPYAHCPLDPTADCAHVDEHCGSVCMPYLPCVESYHAAHPDAMAAGDAYRAAAVAAAEAAQAAATSATVVPGVGV